MKRPAAKLEVAALPRIAARPGARLLMILMGSVGDVVRGMALACALKQAYPACKLTWLVEPRCAELLAAHPAIDRVLVFERARGVSALIRLVRDLRGTTFDVALDLQRHFKSGVFTALSAAPVRIGFSPRESKEFNWLFNTHYIAPSSEAQSKLTQYLSFAELLGAEATLPPQFGLKPVPRPVGLSAQAYVLFVLGSNWESKDWLAPGYLELARRVLSETSNDLVLTGDARKIEMGRALEAALNSPRVKNLVAQTSLGELVSVIGSARICVGPDSGPAHIAAACGVRYVTLFGPTDEHRVGAYAQEGFFVRSSIGCAPCERRVCPGLDRLCMRLITPQLVWETVKPMLEAEV